MADITKCSGEGCPLKNECYRFLATDSYRQSYFMTAPYNQETKECEHLWKQQ
jgi:hypothetical protein